MKFCPYCGADLLDSDALFCANCGKKLPPHEAGITEPLNEEKRPVSAVPPKNETPQKEKKRKNFDPFKNWDKRVTRGAVCPPEGDERNMACRLCYR